MLRVGAKYQHLTCDAGCCFQTAQKRDVIFSRRRRYFAAGSVAAAIAPATALSNDPADAQTSVGPSKVKPAVPRKSGHCDRWRRRSAPKSCLHGCSPNSELDCIWRPAPEGDLVKAATQLSSEANDTSIRRIPWLPISSRW